MKLAIVHHHVLKPHSNPQFNIYDVRSATMIKKHHLSHSLRHHFSHHSGHPVNNTLNHQWVVSEPSFTSTTMYVYFYLSATRTPEPWLRRPAAFCWGLNKLRKALPLLETSWHLTQISKPQAPSGKENLLGREKTLHIENEMWWMHVWYNTKKIGTHTLLGRDHLREDHVEVIKIWMLMLVRDLRSCNRMCW